MTPPDEMKREEAAIDRVTEALTEDLAEDHPPDEVQRVVGQARERYADAPVRDFVPALVERDVREQLTEPQPAAGSDPASVHDATPDSFDDIETGA